MHLSSQINRPLVTYMIINVLGSISCLYSYCYPAKLYSEALSYQSVSGCAHPLNETCRREKIADHMKTSRTAT